jgi:hypothetical protein
MYHDGKNQQQQDNRNIASALQENEATTTAPSQRKAKNFNAESGNSNQKKTVLIVEKAGKQKLTCSDA